MFNQFYNNGLVYRDITKVNWCENDKTILANEQVISGTCERCGGEVVQKDMAQWMLKITEFADELHDDLEGLDWDESIKQAQREWIGRKEGSLIPFQIKIDSNPSYLIIEKSLKCDIEDLSSFGNYKIEGNSESWGNFYRFSVIPEKEIEFINFIKEQLNLKNDDGGSWYTDSCGTSNYVIFAGKSINVSTKEGLDEFQKYCLELNIPKEQQDISPFINIFTTRADTLFGATYLVLAPEHEMLQNLKNKISNWKEVESYLDEVSKKSDLDRQQSRDKSGVQLKGVEAINPATNEPVSMWVADYVLGHFGTGAVMAVPAHDERDCEFALKYNLPFKFVVLPSAGEIGNSRQLITTGENAFITEAGQQKNPTTSKAGSGEQARINAEWNAMYDLLAELDGKELPVGKRFCCDFEGKLIQSPGFNAKTSEEARNLITEAVGGTMTKTYRLRDWGISRQRYWGCPIPIVYDPEGNAHPVPDEHLPWILPTDVDFTPDGTAPLARSEELKKRTEEIFGKGWTPEVDTMDTFVDSSWYFYRYLDAHNDQEFASQESLQTWMPVDMYFGGAEHTTMHLLYSRFWTKALHTLGLVGENEPYKARLNRGLILGPDGAKMSKSKGNVIDPDEVVSHVGADTVRMYLAFIGPFNEPGNYPWDPNGVVGIKRFLERVWRLQNKITKVTEEKILSELHQTIKKVSLDIDRLKLNTAISTMMIFVNNVEKSSGISQNDYDTFLQLLAPFAPHITEELWMRYHDDSIHLSEFPMHDESLILSSLQPIPVQINGKVRAQAVIEEGESRDELEQRVLNIPEVQKWTAGNTVQKFIYVPNKIINIVI